ncbi:MAG: lysophospholipid acyltransferase family protein [Chloroflexi bacterium]|nr:lysophospholipid acyltransferase family protein [Chloroflexota bacterium]
MTRLPRWVLVHASGGLGLLFTLAFWQKERAVTRNLSLLLGIHAEDRRAKRLAKQVFRHYVRMSFEVLELPTLSDATLLERCTMTGLEHLEAALRKGHGAILAVPHMGNWDAAARVCSALGHPITVVANDDWAAHFARALRERPGVRVITRHRSARPLYAALRRNEAIGLVADLAPIDVPAVHVEFAGQLALFPTGPVRLSLRTGAPILPCICVHRHWGEFQVLVGPPLRTEDSLWTSSAVQDVTQQLAERFEQFARAYPEQWYVMSRPKEPACDAAAT